MKKKTLFPLLTLATVSLLMLSACGGSDSGTTTSGDSFFSQVAAIIGTTSDSTEPVSTDGITATSPDTTEPQPII